MQLCAQEKLILLLYPVQQPGEFSRDIGEFIYAFLLSLTETKLRSSNILLSSFSASLSYTQPFMEIKLEPLLKDRYITQIFILLGLDV